MCVRSGLQGDDGDVAVCGRLHAVCALGDRLHHPLGHIVRRRRKLARRLRQREDHPARRGERARGESGISRHGRTPSRHLREAREGGQGHTALVADRDSGGREVVRDQRALRTRTGAEGCRDYRGGERASLRFPGKAVRRRRVLLARQPELHRRQRRPGRLRPRQ